MRPRHSGTARTLALAAVCVLGWGVRGAAQPAAFEWEPDVPIQVPINYTCYLALGANGDLYVTTFNSSSSVNEIGAFRIAGATGDVPQITVFDRYTAPASRGYSGVAVDGAGSVFVTFDQGDFAPSFIKKFTPELEPDTSFGRDGVMVAPKTRLLGVAAHGDRVLVAVNWAKFLVMSSGGDFLGMTPEMPTGLRFMVRDIDYFPATNEVFGVDRDSVYVFSGGTLDNLAGYRIRALISGTGPQQSGAGIYYSPAEDRIYYTLNATKQLGRVTRSGGSLEILRIVEGANDLGAPTDAVVTADGRFLFVSDLLRSHVYRFRRSGAVAPAIAAPPAAPAPAPPPAPAQTATLPPLIAAFESRPGAEQPARLPDLADVDRTPSLPTLSPLQPLTPAAPGEALPALPPARPFSPELADAPPPPLATAQWEPSIDAARAKAAEGQKVAVLFVTPQSQTSQEIENDVFASGKLQSDTPGVVWARVDVSRDAAAMTTYGFFKVPVLIVFDREGNELVRLEGAFTAEQVEAELAK